ncbi:glutamate-cysteine ligase family protein [Ktedonobacter robiniae]|uniref:Glutamate--cysteine ligase n=1 Tax=Ktedonobacter robiniae TaxID=2778365 RepID=A0ABQ3UWF6_9CHLR|nr:glutamate-cysteine ligase family protein [Ktedonobacter robiniae]GHO57000.1 hypothetical protein KSB_54750 [Ktedonobacter robiniae]
MFAFGIEHEVAFLNRQGVFADYSNTTFEEFDRIVAQLPRYEADYPQLRIGDAGIKVKRWYIEGFERYSLEGRVTACPPKGIEIRTTIHSSIGDAVQELTESFDLLRQAAHMEGFTPVLVSYHPYQRAFTPNPPLNAYEQQRRVLSPEKRTAFLPMVTYGPDLNLSLQGMSNAEIIDAGKKLTYYSPFIVPFSASSPFYEGKAWEGLSVRTFIRTGIRPATMVFLERSEDLIASSPSLTKPARLPAEVGRIEFKACDSCDDFALYAALLALLKGLLLDETLPERLLVPDTALHQASSRKGFVDARIEEGAWNILEAASKALCDDSDHTYLRPLYALLREKKTPAHTLIQAYQSTGSIEEALQTTYPSTE